MKRRVGLWAAAAAMAVLAWAEPAFDAEAAARAFVEDFLAKRSIGAERLSPELQKALPPAKLVQLAEQILAQAGPYLRLEGSEASGQVVTVRALCEKSLVTFRLSFGAGGRAAGFFVTKLESRLPWSLPPYAKPDSYREEAALVDSGGWPLPALLALPAAAAGRLPAAVLVHGSGPSDRDERVGANRVFADLAAGLAARGIATLRYDKRTLVYADRLAARASSIDVSVETVDDAVAALGLLAKDPRIDPRRIYLVGHSLGAMLGPMIASRAGAKGLRLAGLVLLAPNARPLEDVIVDQVRYLSKLAPPGPDSGAALAALEAAAARVKGLAPEASAADPAAADLPLGIPPSWWRSIAGYDPVAAARGLGLPLLVVHGARDYQVMRSEAELWKKGLAGMAEARCLLLPGLNHLMIAGSGIPSPAEYERPGHVAPELVGAVADFCLGGP